MTDDLNEQLPDFALMRTSDPAVSRERMRRRFGQDLIVLDPGNFCSTTRYAKLSSLAILQAQNTTQIRLPIAKSNSTHVHFLTRGRCVLTTGEQRYDIEGGQGFVCTSGHDAYIDYEPYEELVLVIPPATIERMFMSLTGFPPKCPIKFEPMLDASDRRFVGYRDLVLMLAGHLDQPLSVWPQAMLKQLECACVIQLLFCSRHNLSHLLDPTPCAAALPDHVQLAEHFAEVNADRNFTVEELAKACAVSSSTLARAFLKHRGCTPTAFIKRIRLARAKELLESRAAITVVGVALRCGFSNPSRFGKDYQQAFGETPTQTLRRLRVQPMDA